MLATRMRSEAHNFKYENGYNIPVHVLAGKLSKFCQLISQLAFYRTPCVSTDYALRRCYSYTSNEH